MKIRAAVARAPSAPMSLEDLELEGPRDDEILVRLVATGVCHTDIAMRDQAYPVPQPIVLGHEGAGVVDKIGRSVTKVAPGDHVVMTFNSCGRCPSCDEHLPSYCHDFFGYNFGGSRPDGSTPLAKGGERVNGNFFGQSSFATYALCHERNIVRVRKDAPLELLGPLACGIQTGTGAIINALKLRPGQSIAVYGTGSVGLSGIIAACLSGAGTVIAIDVNEERLKLAGELGATHTINPDRDNPVETIMRIAGRAAGVDFTFETTGLVPVIRQAIESLAPRGVCGFVGASPVGTEVPVDLAHMMTAGRALRGIVEGDSNPDVFIPMMIDLYLQGRFPFDKLVTFYPFDKINEAVHDSETGKAVKPIVRMG